MTAVSIYRNKGKTVLKQDHSAEMATNDASTSDLELSEIDDLESSALISNENQDQFSHTNHKLKKSSLNNDLEDGLRDQKNLKQNNQNTGESADYGLKNNYERTAIAEDDEDEETAPESLQHADNSSKDEKESVSNCDMIKSVKVLLRNHCLYLK